MGNKTLHPSPKEGMVCVAPQTATYGARKEAIALTNCPKVSALANYLPLTTLLNKGLSEVCINALPMPNSENEASISR